MHIAPKVIEGKHFKWTQRCPETGDAEALSKLRVLIDSETENMDREPGEGVLCEADFQDLIQEDLKTEGHLFLIAQVENEIVGYARCVRKKLKRFRHQAEFGICLKQAYCGCGIGNHLLKSIIEWSEKNEIEKISLYVIETNLRAIHLYKKYDFIQEGLLINDRKHRDGKYYNTIIMGRQARNRI